MVEVASAPLPAEGLVSAEPAGVARPARVGRPPRRQKLDCGLMDRIFCIASILRLPLQLAALRFSFPC